VAAVVASNATWNTTPGNKSVAPTLVVGELIVVVQAHSAVTSGLGITDNQSGTYVQLGSYALNRSSADSLSIWVRTALVSSAVAHSISTTGATASTGGGLCAIRISGMTKAGSSAVKTSVGGTAQFAKQENQATGTPAPVFPQTPSAEDLCIGAVLTQSNVTTNTVPPASWAELQDLGYNTPTTGIEIASRDSGQNAATVTWGGATPTGFASVVVELDTTGAVPPSLTMPPIAQGPPGTVW